MAELNAYRRHLGWTASTSRLRSKHLHYTPTARRAAYVAHRHPHHHGNFGRASLLTATTTAAAAPTQRPRHPRVGDIFSTTYDGVSKRSLIPCACGTAPTASANAGVIAGWTWCPEPRAPGVATCRGRRGPPAWTRGDLIHTRRPRPWSWPRATRTEAARLSVRAPNPSTWLHPSSDARGLVQATTERRGHLRPRGAHHHTAHQPSATNPHRTRCLPACVPVAALYFREPGASPPPCPTPSPSNRHHRKVPSAGRGLAHLCSTRAHRRRPPPPRLGTTTGSLIARTPTCIRTHHDQSCLGSAMASSPPVGATFDLDLYPTGSSWTLVPSGERPRHRDITSPVRPLLLLPHLVVRGSGSYPQPDQALS